MPALSQCLKRWERKTTVRSIKVEIAIFDNIFKNRSNAHDYDKCMDAALAEIGDALGKVAARIDAGQQHLRVMVGKPVVGPQVVDGARSSTLFWPSPAHCWELRR